MEDDQQDEAEDIDLGELDLDEIKIACSKKGKYFVPSKQIELLQASILKTKDTPQLGIEREPQKDSKRKQLEEGEKRGRNMNKQRIPKVCTKLVESSQYPAIKAAFFEVSKVCQ